MVVGLPANVCVGRDSCQYHVHFISIITLGDLGHFPDAEVLSVPSYLEMLFTISSLEKHIVYLRNLTNCFKTG